MIGRGGGTVQRINEATGSRVRVSNAGEHFPGTMERVVLVTGTTEQVAAGGVEVRTSLNFIHAGRLNKLGEVCPEGDQSGQRSALEGGCCRVSAAPPTSSSAPVVRHAGSQLHCRCSRDTAHVLHVRARAKPPLDAPARVCPAAHVLLEPPLLLRFQPPQTGALHHQL